MSNAQLTLYNNVNKVRTFNTKSMYNLKKSNGIKVGNTLLQGGGANSLQNRGANQTAAYYSTNPYFRNDFYSRWQEYVRMYYTSWEVQKIVDIVPNDAFRIPCEFKGFEDEEDKATFEKAWREYDIDNKFKMMATQERLLGGCVGLMGVKSDKDDPSKPLNLNTVDRGDFTFLNVVPINQISLGDYNNDPFDKDFNSPETYLINGQTVHKSRLLLFDGAPLFNRTAMNILQNFRYNPAGFGESVIAPLYDALVREIGTQQAGYHLVNLASVLLVKGANTRMLKATNGGGYEALEEICEQISIYRGAVIDGKDVEITQHDASFGSVPELLMTYMQVLSAGSDIPAVRFLGEAPGGLNATGTADLENYYNNVAAFQQQRIKPKQLKFSRVFGRSIFGREKWERISKQFDIEYKPLWNMSAEQQANVDNTYSSMLDSSVSAGTITAEFANKEKKARGIFLTDMDIENDTPDMIIEDGKASDPNIILDELEEKLEPKTEQVVDLNKPVETEPLDVSSEREAEEIS